MKETPIAIDEAEETKPKPPKPSKQVLQIYDTSIKLGTIVTLDYGDLSFNESTACGWRLLKAGLPVSIGRFQVHKSCRSHTSPRP
jgi:hypothetical protein